ncbi:hypothetical protein [Trinickia fusca]|uniref:RHS repeat protein n=1 Tax=Trinickia fusca TaxID=2419777 RepID=A0A494XK16_9BURK|nr:hypothetical protein [Trinickia fusca]RKP48434.1 hypothetical protein D7S89_14105 [Trinickia fusca]
MRLLTNHGNTRTMQYNANGNQIQQPDGSGNTIARTYSTTFNALLTETVYAVWPPIRQPPRSY